jgi:hypothetical protein
MPILVFLQCLRLALYLLDVMLAIAPQLASVSFNATSNPFTQRLHLHIGSIVPDGVTGSQSDPLRNRSVLFLGLGQLLLCSEGLVALLLYVSTSFILLQSFR